MPHPEWVLGMPLPKELSNLPTQGELPEDVRNWISSELQTHLNGSEAVGCVLTTNKHLYFGVQQKHSHPNCYGSAIEVAAGIACTSGSHSFLAAGVYRPEGEYIFSGVDLERLAEHFPENSRDMTLIRCGPRGMESFPHSARLPEPAGGRRRPKVKPVPAVAYEKYPLELTLEQVFDKQLPSAFVRHVDRRLRTLYLQNSTADGRTKPGRKRHASCVFTPDGHLFFGVNLRSDVEACDRCSEWNALGASFVGGHDQELVGAIVYSPDYKRGRVECCGKCRNSLGSCIHPQFGDMLVRYVESGHPPRIWLYSEMPNISYAQAEGDAVV
jgi:hypothetical protein